ncbi:MAG: tryptophan--tRNA ligase [Gammaproteobacteria bacterium]|nr:tryptophan--tRNA ligase [Gammaproteobacteria bacterium]
MLSGMRTTGNMHLGHYHGVLKNWLKLQHEYECFFFVADLHSLTTHYENPEVIEQSLWNMVIDWLAVGINPGSAHIFIQSQVPEIAELHLLLSMITPLGWLERVPTYKDQISNIKGRNLHTYGFLGYPLLQSADILIFKASHVPVGEDQVSHIEMTREVARHFNYLYGRDNDYEEKALAAITKLGKKSAALYRKLLKAWQEQGDQDSLQTGQSLIESVQHISISDKERLLGYLEGGGKIILPEPQPLLTTDSALPGLDGRKMSKSYQNTISLRDSADDIQHKISKMPTDPARVKRSDPGEPEKCPVWALHKVYSDDSTKEWVQYGCRNATIGCLECKKPLADAIIEEQQPIQQRAKEFAANPGLVRSVVANGCEAAREVARDTLDEVQKAMGLNSGDYEPLQHDT